MKRANKKAVLLIFFIVLTLTSIAVVYALQQAPIQETITNTVCTYTSIATYDYTATLEPNNTISDNRTTLKSNEGILYAALTKQIDITLAYTFQATLPTDVEITYSVVQSLTTVAWQYVMIETPQAITNQPQIQVLLSPFNKTELQAVKKQIEAETGTASSDFTFEIAPTFMISANTSMGLIKQTFAPTLDVDLKRTDQGNVITIENLQQTKTGEITEDQTIVHSEIVNQRYASFVFLAVSAIGLVSVTYFFSKTRHRAEKSQLKKLIDSYKDLIVETKESPKSPQETTTIEVKDMKELSKTAEILARPILHATSGPEHTFYIIDGNAIYRHKITEEQAQEKTQTRTMTE